MRGSCRTCDAEYLREYYKKNKQRMYAKNREWVMNNREKDRQSKRDWKKRNPKADKEYYEKNKEWILPRNSEYRKNNPDKMRYYKRKWKVVNREKVYQDNRTRELNKQSGVYSIKEWENTMSYFNHECAYCGTIPELLTQDHVIPLSKGGPYTVENIIPACGSCNSSKNNATLIEWYETKPFFEESRLLKIEQYLETVKPLQTI